MMEGHSRMADLTGRVVLVSGGANGIGRAIAQGSARAGAGVVIVDQDQPAAEEAAAALKAEGCRALPVSADIKDEGAVQEAADRARRWCGRIDGLVNCAGIRATGGIQDTSVETWNEVLSVNLRGAALLSKSVIPPMRKAGGGSIVNITSSVVYVPLPNLAAYTVSKAGLDGLTRTMALELAPLKIRVNSVSPGTVRTRWVDRLLREHPETRESETSELETRVKNRHLLRRLGEPEEIASMVVYLLSDEAAFITGSSICVDGGYAINGGYLEG